MTSKDYSMNDFMAALQRGEISLDDKLTPLTPFGKWAIQQLRTRQEYERFLAAWRSGKSIKALGYRGDAAHNKIMVKVTK